MDAIAELIVLAVACIVAGAAWIVALRVRAASWSEAVRRHPTQANVAVGVFWALGICGLITFVNPEGAARNAIILICSALLLASLVAAARDLVRQGRGRL